MFELSQKYWKNGRDIMIGTLLDAPAAMCTSMTSVQRIRFQECYQLEKRYDRPFRIDNGDIIASFKNNPVLRLIHQRVVEWGNAEIATPVALFLVTMSTSRNTTKAVLWAYTAVFLYLQSKECITMSDISNAFQFGFPNNDAIKIAWDKQKDPAAPNGNLLDDPKNWKFVSSGSVSEEVLASLA